MVRAFFIDYGKLGSTPVIVLIKKGHWFKSSICFSSQPTLRSKLVFKASGMLAENSANYKSTGYYLAS